MKSTVEPEEGNKVKVVVTFSEDEPEFQAAVADTWVEISKQVRIPGFRAGKAPRKILEKQLGADAARPDSLQQAIPELLVVLLDLRQQRLQLLHHHRQGLRLLLQRPVSLLALVHQRKIAQATADQLVQCQRGARALAA